ncbi:hypothetical protein GBAR_LOCUS16985, partial [Geodia barretti]
TQRNTIPLIITSGNVKHCWRAGATQLGICLRCSGCITRRQRERSSKDAASGAADTALPAGHEAGHV